MTDPISRMRMPVLARLLAACVLTGYALTGCDATKPEMPVTITFRQSAWGQGLVAVFHNTSNRHLGIVLVLENSTLGQKDTRTLQIGPYETVEMGWMEDWKFLSGETVTLKHDDYRTLTVTVP